MTDLLPISIAMATYNGATYLREQLDSLALQTVLPIEIVITDDGSTDATEAVVRAFASTVPFPVLWNSNAVRLGFRANFMRAASLCTGRLIAFCDQDDTWAPNKLEIAQAAFKNPDVMLFHHEARVVRNGVVVGHQVRKVSNTDPLVGPLQSAPWQSPLGYTEVIRAGLRDYDALWVQTQDYKGLEEREAHDQWYYFLASVLGCIAFHSAPLADYRQHDANVYGVGTLQHSRLARIRWLLENRIEVYNRLATAAYVRGRILGQAESMAGTIEHATGLAAGARAWTTLGKSYKDRAMMFEGSFPQRIKALRELMIGKAYSPHGVWTFGSKAKVKDIGLGLFLAPLVRSFGHVGTGSDWNCGAGDGSALVRLALKYTPVLVAGPTEPGNLIPLPKAA